MLFFPCELNVWEDAVEQVLEVAQSAPFNYDERVVHVPAPKCSNLRLNGLRPIGPGAASTDFLTNSDLANHTDLYSHTSPPSLTLPGSLGVRNGGVVCSGSSGSSSDPRHFFVDLIYPPFTTVSGNSNGGSGGSGGGDGDGNNNSGNFGIVFSVSFTSTANFPHDPAFHSLSSLTALGFAGFPNNCNNTTVAAAAAAAAAGQIELWQFLLELLTDWHHRNAIHLVSEDSEYKLNNPEQVAYMWGQRKDKPTMNNEKLSPAVRYCYDGDMISNVHGKRFVSKFICDLKTLLGFSADELDSPVKRLLTKTSSLRSLEKDPPLDSSGGSAFLSAYSPPSDIFFSASFSPVRHAGDSPMDFDSPFTSPSPFCPFVRGTRANVLLRFTTTLQISSIMMGTMARRIMRMIMRTEGPSLTTCPDIGNRRFYHPRFHSPSLSHQPSGRLRPTAMPVASCRSSPRGPFRGLFDMKTTLHESVGDTAAGSSSSPPPPFGGACDEAQEHAGPVETVLRAGSQEKEAAVVAAADSVETQHFNPGCVFRLDPDIEVTKDNQLFRIRFTRQKGLQFFVEFGFFIVATDHWSGA
nr:unnamed protein product [Spirometra erinaceieuropaei]